MMSIDVRSDHLAIIKDILRQFVPDRRVVVFGSRAKDGGHGFPWRTIPYMVPYGQNK